MQNQAQKKGFDQRSYVVDENDGTVALPHHNSGEKSHPPQGDHAISALPSPQMTYCPQTQSTTVMQPHISDECPTIATQLASEPIQALSTAEDSDSTKPITTNDVHSNANLLLQTENSTRDAEGLGLDKATRTEQWMSDAEYPLYTAMQQRSNDIMLDSMANDLNRGESLLALLLEEHEIGQMSLEQYREHPNSNRVQSFERPRGSDSAETIDGALGSFSSPSSGWRPNQLNRRARAFHC